METEAFRNGDYSDFYEKAKQIVQERCMEELLKEILGRYNCLEEALTGDLLEKAWKRPWGWGKNEDFKPILVTYGENLDKLDGNSRIERNNELTEEIMGLHCWNLRNKMYCKKDWRDFK